MRGPGAFWAVASGLWLGFAAVAVACGAAREFLLRPHVGEAAAHVLGTLVVCGLYLLLMRAFLARTGPHAKNRLAALGLAWALAAMAFEFGFGRLVAGHSWERLLADYNLLAGRVWVLVLATLYAGPRLVARPGAPPARSAHAD